MKIIHNIIDTLGASAIFKSGARWVFQQAGLEVRRLSVTDKRYALSTEVDDAIRETLSVVKEYTMLSEARLHSLYEEVVYCERAGIPGALVECGVWKGGALALMARANICFGATRRPIHGFDAFSDLCFPDEKLDGHRAVDEVRQITGYTGKMTGQLVPIKGVYDAHGGHGVEKAVRQLLTSAVVGARDDMVFLHKGWFQETVNLAAPTIGPIALLRLDGDYFSSVDVCLRALYDQVSDGGVIVIDDYGYYEGCTRAVDAFRSERSIRSLMHYADCEQKYHRYWIKDGR
jgi:hypothetical protein